MTFELWGYRVYNKSGMDGIMIAQGSASSQDAARELAEQFMKDLGSDKACACVSKFDGSAFVSFSATAVLGKKSLPDEKRIMMDILLCAEEEASRPAYADEIAEKWETEVHLLQRQIDAPRDQNMELDMDRLYTALEQSKDIIIKALEG